MVLAASAVSQNLVEIYISKFHLGLSQSETAAVGSNEPFSVLSIACQVTSMTSFILLGFFQWQLPHIISYNDFFPIYYFAATQWEEVSRFHLKWYVFKNR